MPVTPLPATAITQPPSSSTTAGGIDTRSASQVSALAPAINNSR
jgi:hypothetical protein